MPEKLERLEATEKPWRTILLDCPDRKAIEVEEDDDCFVDKIIHRSDKFTRTYTLQDNGSTEIRTEYKDDRQDEISRAELDWRMPIFEMAGESILSEDMFDAQNAVNLNATLMDANSIFGGFRSTTYLNAVPKGEYKVNRETGKEEFVPAGAHESGPGMINYLAGLKTTSDDGSVDYKNVGIHESQPISPQTFSEAIEINLKFMYLRAKLGHMLEIGTPRISGKARGFTQTDFATTLEGISTNIESVIRDICLAVLKLVEPNNQATCTVKLQPAYSLDDQRIITINNAVGGGLMSRGTGRKLANIADPEGEAQRIEAERTRNIELGFEDDNFATQTTFSSSESGS